MSPETERSNHPSGLPGVRHPACDQRPARPRIRRLRWWASLAAGLGAGLLAAASLPSPSRAAEIRAVESGVAVIHLNVPLLQDLGLAVTEVRATAEVPSGLERIETPHWAFAIGRGSDLLFRVEQDRAEPQQIPGGRVLLEGEILFRDEATGTRQSLSAMEIVPAGEAPGRSVPLHLRDRATGEVFFRLVDSMFDFSRGDERLHAHYLNAEIAREWAERLGRPHLAGWTVGIVELDAGTGLRQSSPSAGPPALPEFGDTVDVALGVLESLTYVARQGSWPNGRIAASMATTACNVGETDVPWFAPMEEDHPVIAMALYRLHEGRFEQIGISDVKHGFYAQSNDLCAPCENPSDGTFLGVGCSDTYGVNNNADRGFLAPRSEVNPYTGVWECEGSHFAGGQPDCIRRHEGEGHGPLDHRLTTADADLAIPGATYYYEAYYVVRRDDARANNLGSRRFTASWDGSVWTFSTPSSGNPLVLGPALGRWGQMRTTASAGPEDGDVLLAVQTSDLGGGVYRYEYALFNIDSDLQVRSFRIPVPPGAAVENIGFHDPGGDPADDWTATVADGAVTWETGPYGDPDARPLSYGLLFNFRFDAAAVPAPASAVAGLWRPHDPDHVVVATLGPAVPSAAPGAEVPARLRLSVRPNPTAAGATLAFGLPTAGEVSLGVYAPDGRRVRLLFDGPQAAGAYAFGWDGNDDAGRPVPSGVYYVRLGAPGAREVRRLTILR